MISGTSIPYAATVFSILFDDGHIVSCMLLKSIWWNFTCAPQYSVISSSVESTLLYVPMIMRDSLRLFCHDFNQVWELVCLSNSPAQDINDCICYLIYAPASRLNNHPKCGSNSMRKRVPSNYTWNGQNKFTLLKEGHLNTMRKQKSCKQSRNRSCGIFMLMNIYKVYILYHMR